MDSLKEMKYFQNNMKNFYNYLKRELYLLYSSPWQYLFLYQNSKTETVSIKPFNPEVKKSGLAIVKKLQSKLSGVTIHFVGSAALEISGQNDIDILVEAPKQIHASTLKLLESLYGRPTNVFDDFSEWCFTYMGNEVQLVLVLPTSKLLNEQIITFRMLSKPEVKKAYENLKVKANGVSKYEYEKRRIEFFNKVMKQRFGKKFRIN